MARLIMWHPATVMLHEMTDDNSVLMPVIVTTVVAYGVRKTLSPSSIYTLKLLRRGHIVPEGLQSALDDARNVGDVMDGIFRVADGKATAESFAGVMLIARQGQIVRVRHPFGAIGENSGQPAGQGNSFVTLEPSTPLVDAMRELQSTRTGCGVMFARPESDRIEDVVGVLTLREVSAYRIEMAEHFG